MSMCKQLMTFSLLAAIFLMAVSFTNAQSTQKNTGQKKTEQKSAEQKGATQKGAEQKETEGADDDLQLRKSVILSELSALNIDASGLDSPLARAVVKTEIADIAWNLDKQWARQLLKDAFELALPDKE